MYDIVYTDQAIDDLRWFSRYQQNVIVDGIEEQLRYDPTIETRNRKRLRPNSIAEWELRLGDFRVLYDVEQLVLVVEIQRIGEKHGNTLKFRDKEEDV